MIVASAVAQRAQPRRPRERRDVRHARTEVEPRARRGAACADSPSRRRACERGGLRHARTGALAQAQIALGGELGVGVDHDPPRNAELARQIAGDGTRAPGRRAPLRIARRSWSSICAPRVRELARLTDRSSSIG